MTTSSIDTSTIDDTKPVAGTPTTLSVRTVFTAIKSVFTAAKNDINALFTAVEAITFPMGEVSYFDMTGTIVTITGTSDGTTNMVKVAPTTTGNFAFESDNGGANNGRLRYTGTVTKKFHCSASVSVSPSTNNDSFIFGIAKNGTTLNSSKILQKTATSTDVHSATISAMIELATNDYIELYIGNVTGANNVTVKTLNLFFLGVKNP